MTSTENNSTYQYRVVWKHDGFPKRYHTCEEYATAEKWYNFIKNEWDLHWRCEDSEYGHDCRVEPRYRDIDPELLELYVEARFVGNWAISLSDKFAPVGKLRSRVRLG